MRRLTMVALLFAVLAAACGTDVAPTVESQSGRSSSTSTSQAADNETLSPTTTANAGDLPAGSSDDPVEGAATPVTDPPATTQATEPIEEEQQSSTRTPEPASPADSEEGGAGVGEVPSELLEQIIDAAVASSGVPAREISVLRAESIIWPGGSLGCGEPGETYTHAPVDGYWVELDAGGDRFDYRSAATGFFERCKRPFPPAPTG